MKRQCGHVGTFQGDNSAVLNGACASYFACLPTWEKPGLSHWADWNFSLIIDTAEKARAAPGSARTSIQAWEALFKHSAQLAEQNKRGSAHRVFNRQIRFADDTSISQRVDYWGTPIESLPPGLPENRQQLHSRHRPRKRQTTIHPALITHETLSAGRRTSERSDNPPDWFRTDHLRRTTFGK